MDDDCHGGAVARYVGCDNRVWYRVWIKGVVIGCERDYHGGAVARYVGCDNRVW